MSCQDEGRLAFEKGLSLIDNPYSSTGKSIEQYVAWDSGYINAENESKNNTINQFIFDNFYENKDDLTNEDCKKYAAYMNANFPSILNETIKKNLDLYDIKKLKLDPTVECLGYGYEIRRRIINVIKADIIKRLKLL